MISRQHYPRSLQRPNLKMLYHRHIEILRCLRLRLVPQRQEQHKQTCASQRFQSPKSPSAYQYIQPTAKPTPRSRNRRGNSITGALTGIRAVISHKHDMTDEITVPMIMQANTAPPGPATAREWPQPRKSPLHLCQLLTLSLERGDMTRTIANRTARGRCQYSHYVYRLINLPRECYHLLGWLVSMSEGLTRIRVYSR